MTLFPNRYKLLVVGADGLMHQDSASHHIEVPLVRFLLEKRALKPFKRVEMTDTCTGKPVTKEEFEAI